MTISETGTNSIDSLLEGESWLRAPAAGGATTTLTYSFMTTDPEGMTGFLAMTSAQQQGTLTALAAWAAVANVKFVQVASGGQIQFGTADLGTGASAVTDWNYSGNGVFTHNYVYLNNTDNYADRNDSAFNLVFTPGTYAPSVLIHEIGHALGLKHPGNYDGTPPPYLPASEDNRDYSVMSYNDGNATLSYYSAFGGKTSSVTPMMFDIQAIQYLYGANKSTNAGDSTYSFTNTSIPQAIWDAGGVNTFDFSACTKATIIDLVAGTFSSTLISASAPSDNVSIAYGTLIQNAIAGSGGSTIYCNSGADTVTGGTGNDMLYVSTGTVVFDGKGGTNSVVLTAASDLTHDGFANVQSIDLQHYAATMTGTEYTAFMPIVRDAAAITVAFTGAAADYILSTTASGGLEVSDTVAGRDGAVALASVQDLQFSDVTVAPNSPLVSFIAEQNALRTGPDVSPFHYGIASATTNNVNGEASANLGSGYNAVILAGAESQYGVSVNSGGTLTLTDNSSHQVYTITGDHYLIFDNGAMTTASAYQEIDFVLQGNDAQIAAVYNTALGRQPDLPGLEFYSTQIAQGSLTLRQAAVYFINSTEFQAIYPAAAKPADDGGPNDQAFIASLYQNVLHRTPSASEVSFYVQDLQGTLPGVPQQDRAQLLLYFSLSDENHKDISGWLV